MKRLDLTGTKFGRLTALRYDHSDRHGTAYWLCKCLCGTEKIVRTHDLRSGNTKSCGCLNREVQTKKLSSFLHLKGAKHQCWRGGRGYYKDGYVWIHDPSHTNARNGGRVLEHVKVMSGYLGRPLLPGETVHHKNGIRDDNRLNNLELRLSNHHPAGQSVKDDLIPYWIQMLERYAPEKLIKVKE